MRRTLPREELCLKLLQRKEMTIQLGPLCLDSSCLWSLGPVSSLSSGIIFEQATHCLSLSSLLIAIIVSIIALSYQSKFGLAGSTDNIEDKQYRNRAHELVQQNFMSC